MKKKRVSEWEISPFGPPEESGVYCIMTMNQETKKSSVLYIGSSKNISKRILNPSHPYRRLLDKAEYPYLIYTKFKVCENYLELEKNLIQRLRPKYNSNFVSSRL